MGMAGWDPQPRRTGLWGAGPAVTAWGLLWDPAAWEAQCGWQGQAGLWMPSGPWCFSPFFSSETFTLFCYSSWFFTSFFQSQWVHRRSASGSSPSDLETVGPAGTHWIFPFLSLLWEPLVRCRANRPLVQALLNPQHQPEAEAPPKSRVWGLAGMKAGWMIEEVLTHGSPAIEISALLLWKYDRDNILGREGLFWSTRLLILPVISSAVITANAYWLLFFLFHTDPSIVKHCFKL